MGGVKENNMVERLTRKIGYEYEKAKRETQLLEINNKLGKIEDILEKYGIESIEMLEQELKIAREIERLKNKEFDLSNSAIVDKDFYKDFTRDIEKLEADRATWKRACELACETLKQVMGKPLWIGGNIPAPEVKDTEYFYQQAKNEGNDE